MPVRTTRPRQQRSSSTARSNVPSSRATSARMAAASVSSTLRANARSAMNAPLNAEGDGVRKHKDHEATKVTKTVGHGSDMGTEYSTRLRHSVVISVLCDLCVPCGSEVPSWFRRLLDDRIDGHQAAQQRFEAIETQGVLRITLGAGRLLVDLQEHAIDARRDAGAGQRLDVLREPGRDAVACRRGAAGCGSRRRRRARPVAASSGTRACRRSDCDSRSSCRAR